MNAALSPKRSVAHTGLAKVCHDLQCPDSLCAAVHHHVACCISSLECDRGRKPTIGSSQLIGTQRKSMWISSAPALSPDVAWRYGYVGSVPQAD